VRSHWPAAGDTPVLCSYCVLCLSKYPARKLMGSGGLKKLRSSNQFCSSHPNGSNHNGKYTIFLVPVRNILFMDRYRRMSQKYRSTCVRKNFVTKLIPPHLLQFIFSNSQFSKNLGATSKL